MSARRIFLILFIVLSAFVAEVVWMQDWTAKRPLPMSGGLYFPVAVEIPSSLSDLGFLDPKMTFLPAT